MDKPKGKLDPREATRLGERGTEPSPAERRQALAEEREDTANTEEKGGSSRQAEEAATDEKKI